MVEEEMKGEEEGEVRWERDIWAGESAQVQYEGFQQLNTKGVFPLRIKWRQRGVHHKRVASSNETGHVHRHLHCGCQLSFGNMPVVLSN